MYCLYSPRDPLSIRQRITHSSSGGLEDHPVLVGRLSEGNTQFEKLGDDGGEILEEDTLILGVAVDVLAEGLVGDERHVGGQHHERFAGLVLVLRSS